MLARSSWARFEYCGHLLNKQFNVWQAPSQSSGSVSVLVEVGVQAFSYGVQPP